MLRAHLHERCKEQRQRTVQEIEMSSKGSSSDYWPRGFTTNRHKRTVQRSGRCRASGPLGTQRTLQLQVRIEEIIFNACVAPGSVYKSKQTDHGLLCPHAFLQLFKWFEGESPADISRRSSLRSACYIFQKGCFYSCLGVASETV